MTTVEILRGSGGPAVAIVVAATVSKKVTGGKTTFDFTDGGAWLAGALVHHGVPADGFVGVAFAKASFAVPGPVPPGPGGNTIVLPPAAVARFAFEPVQPKAATGSLADDGAAALADFPSEIAFELDPAATNLAKLGDAGLTVYGQKVDLTGGIGAQKFDADLSELIVRFAATSAATLSWDGPASTTFLTAGTAKILAGGYAFPVVRAAGAALAFENAHGWLGLQLDQGLSAQWGNLPQAMPFAGALLQARSGEMAITAKTAVRPFADPYSLWDAGGDPGHPKAASILLKGERGITIASVQSAVRDLVMVKGCAIAAHLDQPCLADGTMPRFDGLEATYIIGRMGADTVLRVEAIPAAPVANVFMRPESYVIDNALLRTDGIMALALRAVLVGGRATQGRLRLSSDLTNLIPMLPHPYAANLATLELVPRRLRAQVAWPSPDRPLLSFSISVPAGDGRQAQAQRQAVDADIKGRGDAFLDILLDVSSFGDQWGVVFLPYALDFARIDGQLLTIDGRLSALYAVPQISWEAVITEDPFGQRLIFNAFAADDGPPAIVNVPTPNLRPMTPKGFIEQFLVDYANGSDLKANFTLPFGLEANVDSAAPSPVALRPLFGLVRPSFGVQTGGIQLGIVAGTDSKHPMAVMPGISFATTDPNDAGYASAILDTPPLSPVASFWDQQFKTGLQGQGPFVPLDRIDLSGYGASAFSHYAEDVGVGVSEARFNVIVGRTSYTLIELRSFLLPWMIPVVNTTIFERDGAAWIERRNSGWRAKGPGEFVFTPAVTVETGGVIGLYNVRNIRSTGGPTFPAPDGTNYAPVYFDCDVGVVTGAAQHGFTIHGGDMGGGRLAGKGFIGYLDLTGSVTPPTMDQVVSLMDVVLSAGGPVAADVEVVDTGIRLTLIGVDAAATSGPGTRTLGVALRGLPHLPRDGSWSVAKRGATQPTPSPVDPLTPVPLVRNHADLATWHMAEPSDVNQLANPATLYGILQSTGTQKLFFEHPTIAKIAGQNPLNCAVTPKLADVGALLGNSALLPAIGSLLDFPAFAGFVAKGDGLATTQNLTKTVHIDDKTLIPLGPISVVLSTNDGPGLKPSPPAPPNFSVITAVIDPAKAPRWSITITNVAFKLLVDGMSSSTDPLVAVVGDIAAADGQAPTLANVRFGYGSSLSVVKDVLSGVEALAEALPGGGASGLDVSFAGTKLRVRDAVSLPKLPLGFGYIEDIALDLGFDVDVLALTMQFHVGVGSDQKPFSWLASPLSGNGLLQLGADKALGVVMQGGIGVGLGIDLAIASGSASVVLAVRLDTTKIPFGVMVLLTGNASVDVLDGLASASLTLTAGLGIQVSPGPASDLLQIPPLIDDYIKNTSITLSAEVQVAIHLSVCWVVHVDWSGEWGFSETLSGGALTSLLP